MKDKSLFNHLSVQHLKLKQEEKIYTQHFNFLVQKLNIFSTFGSHQHDHVNMILQVCVLTKKGLGKLFIRDYLKMKGITDVLQRVPQQSSI